MLFKFLQGSRVTILIFCLVIFCGLTNKKEIPGKLYYLDNRYVEFEEWKWYPHGANLELKADAPSLFDFTQAQKEIQIFYDSNFTQLAVNINLTLKDKKTHYRFFDRNSNLRKEYYKSNDHFYGRYTFYYQNKALAEVNYYDSNGNRMYDSLFYENKDVWQVKLYSDNVPYKESWFYKDNKLQVELYNIIDPETKLNHGVFTIEHDSLTGKPEMYFNNDTIISDSGNPGSMIVHYARFIKADSAGVIKK